MNYDLWRRITDYIILFPLKWYNFLKYVLAFSIYYDNTMVINKNILGHNKQLLDDIIEIFQDNQTISNISENLDMIIIYFNNNRTIQVFDYWLNIIVLRTCLDLFTYKDSSYLFQNDFYVTTEEIKVVVSDNIKCKNVIYVTTKEKKATNALTYTYNYFLFRKKLLAIYHLLICEK